MTLDMARDAVVEIKRRQPFVDVSEIIKEARRKRRPAIDRQEADELLGPVRDQRDPLKDPRPLRETIRAIVAEHFKRPELES